MTELYVEPDWGPVRAIDIASVPPSGRVTSGPARLMGWSVRDASGATNLSDSESDLPATAGFPIATVTITGEAIYDINWSVSFTGPVAALDAFNNQLLRNATVLLNSNCAVAAGVYPQPSVRIHATTGDVVGIFPLANGTAGVDYRGQMSVGIAPVSSSVTELRDGNSALAEIEAPTLGALSQWLGPQGSIMANQITMVNKSGLLAGSIFVQYYRGD